MLTGVLPNYAFYFGLNRSTALAAALLMLFEPIASTLIAVAVWKETISPSFYWGALLVLLINIPDALLVRWFRVLQGRVAIPTFITRRYSPTQVGPEARSR